MQNTNSENGSPYLATRHFTFTKFVYVWAGCANLFAPDCFKVVFVKKLKLKDRAVTIVNDSAAPPEEVSHFIFCMIICKSPLLFHRREEACKVICSETSCCEQSCF